MFLWAFGTMWVLGEQLGPGSSLCSRLCQGHVHPGSSSPPHSLTSNIPCSHSSSLPGSVTSVLCKIYNFPVSDTFPPSPPVYGKGKNTQEIKQLPTAISWALWLLLSSREPLHPWKGLAQDFQLGDDVNQMWSLQRATQGGTQCGWGWRWPGGIPVPLEGWAGFSPHLPFPRAPLTVSSREKQNSQTSFLRVPAALCPPG